MKTTGEDVGRQVKALIVACAVVGLAPATLAQDVTITNPDQLAQVALSANYSIELPFSPWDWRAFPTDWPLWCDFTQMGCLDSLPTSTNFMTSMDWSNVPLASVILTRDVLSGLTTVESADSTDVVASIAAPSGYQPGVNPADRWLWNWYVQATNNSDGWGLTPGQIPSPTITLQTFLADSNAYYSVYESNLDAEAEAAAVAQASSPPTFALGGGFMPMDDDDMMDEGDPCVITNYSIPFRIVSIASDGSGDMVLQWQSCTNAVYIVQTANSLPATSWADVAWMFGTDQQTSWTDTNAVGLTQNFYHVVRGNPNTLNNGIPYGWAVTYGLDPLDPNLATEDPADDGIDNLLKYEYGLNPQIAYPFNEAINTGNGWTTNQTVSLNASVFLPFPFLAVSLSPTMSNIILLTNSSASLKYVLPSNTNINYLLFCQYTDAHTNAIGPIMIQTVTLDTIPPWVEITNPTNSIGNQAFIHLQATIYDPDPKNSNNPGVGRSVKVWINGQPYWNLRGTQLDIPRYPVLPNTNNVITIVAQDLAGNQSQAGLNFYVNTTTATNAPHLFFATLSTNAPVILPSTSQIWISGTMDNPDAIVTATVNGGTPMDMNILTNTFSSMVPINWGTNIVLVTASDAAGNTSSNILTLINLGDYQLGITSPPPFGFFANGQPQVVSGYVSQYKDAGMPNQTNVVSITVNGVGTTLGTSPDGNGNITFVTTNAVPASTNNLPTVLNVVVTWADGTIDPPDALWEGYQMTQMTVDDIYDQEGVYTPCQTSIITAGSTLTYSYSCEEGALSISQSYSAQIADCTSSNLNVREGATTNTTESGWGMTFGTEQQVLLEDGDNWNDTVTYCYSYDGSETFQCPSYYAPNTPVIFTFAPVFYATTGEMDLSQVTFNGQYPVAWDNFGYSVSYVMNVSPGASYNIASGSFGWPQTGFTTSMSDSAGYLITWTDDNNTFSFGGFGNQIAMTISGPSNMLALCNEPEPTATFSSSVAISGGAYSWAASGVQVVDLSDAPTVNVQSTGNGGTASVTLTYVFNNGQPATITTNLFVRKPSSLTTMSSTITSGSGPLLSTIYTYQVNDQTPQMLAAGGLKASEVLSLNNCYNYTNLPTAKKNIDASSGTFQDILTGVRGVPYSESQEILIHVQPNAQTGPQVGCSVRQNCINCDGSSVTAGYGSGDSCCQQ